MPRAEPAASDLINLIAIHCSPKETTLATQEVLELLESRVLKENEEDEEKDEQIEDGDAPPLLSPARQLDRLIRLFTECEQMFS